MPGRTGANAGAGSSARVVSGHEAVPVLPSGQQLNAGSGARLHLGESEGDNELLRVVGWWLRMPTAVDGTRVSFEIIVICSVVLGLWRPRGFGRQSGYRKAAVGIAG